MGFLSGQRFDRPFRVVQDLRNLTLKYRIFSGKAWSRRPYIFDSRGNEVDDPSNLQIGSGSVMLVMSRVPPFYRAMVSSGISLGLVGVRIFKLVDWNRDANVTASKRKTVSRANGNKPLPRVRIIRMNCQLTYQKNRSI